jgi:excisionase family DNA binding protein
MSMRDGAAYLGLSVAAIRAACNSGRLPAKRAGRTILILRSDLEAFADELPDTAATKRPSAPAAPRLTRWEYARLSRGLGEVIFFVASGVKRFTVPFESTIHELGGQGWALVAVHRVDKDETWYFTRPEPPVPTTGA